MPSLPKNIQYRIESRFNQSFVHKYRLNTGEKLTPLSAVADSNSNLVVWLRNIDRLLSLSGHNAKGSTFLDLGAGTGIAALYAATRHPFDSVIGVEIQPELVRLAEANLSKLSTHRPVTVIEMDAGDYLVEKSKTIVFAFNPFGATTMKRFLSKNIETLAETKSIVLLANDHLLETTLGFGHLLKRDAARRLSAVAFKG